MTGKECLQEIRKIDTYINQKQLEYESLCKLRGGFGGMNYEQERVQTSPNGNGFTKISDALVDLQNDINCTVDKFCRIRNERINQIQSLSKVEYAEVLFKRYVEYKSFERIAYEMGYAYKYTCHIHGCALEEFQNNFLKDME